MTDTDLDQILARGNTELLEHAAARCPRRRCDLLVLVVR